MIAAAQPFLGDFNLRTFHLITKSNSLLIGDDLVKFLGKLSEHHTSKDKNKRICILLDEQTTHCTLETYLNDLETNNNDLKIGRIFRSVWNKLDTRDKWQTYSREFNVVLTSPSKFMCNLDNNIIELEDFSQLVLLECELCLRPDHSFKHIAQEVMYWKRGCQETPLILGLIHSYDSLVEIFPAAIGYVETRLDAVLIDGKIEYSDVLEFLDGKIDLTASETSLLDSYLLERRRMGTLSVEGRVIQMNCNVDGFDQLMEIHRFGIRVIPRCENQIMKLLKKSEEYQLEEIFNLIKKEQEERHDRMKALPDQVSFEFTGYKLSVRKDRLMNEYSILQDLIFQDDAPRNTSGDICVGILLANPLSVACHMNRVCLADVDTLENWNELLEDGKRLKLQSLIKRCRVQINKAQPVGAGTSQLVASATTHQNPATNTSNTPTGGGNTSPTPPVPLATATSTTSSSSAVPPTVAPSSLPVAPPPPPATASVPNQNARNVGSRQLFRQIVAPQIPFGFDQNLVPPSSKRSRR